MVIKNDFSTNIFEVAFPPIEAPQDFIDVFQKVNDSLTSVFEDQNLDVLPGSVGDFTAEEMVLRPAPTEAYRQRLDLDLNRIDNGQPLFDTHFYGNICSTQVSLSISREQWRPIAARLYDYEYLIPLLFSSPADLNGIRRHCLRHFMYEHNWQDDPYMGFPANLAGLVEAVELDPEPRTLKFAYCVSRSPERVEFRSCDCLDSVEAILEMVFLRLASYLGSLKAVTEPTKDTFPGFDARDVFTEVCRSGMPPSVDSPLPDFDNALRTFGEQWTESCTRLKQRLSSFVNVGSNE